LWADSSCLFFALLFPVNRACSNGGGGGFCACVNITVFSPPHDENLSSSPLKFSFSHSLSRQRADSLTLPIPSRRPFFSFNERVKFEYEGSFSWPSPFLRAVLDPVTLALFPLLCLLLTPSFPLKTRRVTFPPRSQPPYLAPFFDVQSLFQEPFTLFLNTTLFLFDSFGL